MVSRSRDLGFRDWGLGFVWARVSDLLGDLELKLLSC